jgi:hypothetical protein
MRRNKYKKLTPRSRCDGLPGICEHGRKRSRCKSATIVAFLSIEGCGITASSVAAQEYTSTGAARATASNAKEVAYANTTGRRGSAGNVWRFTAHARTARRETGTAGSAETGALHHSRRLLWKNAGIELRCSTERSFHELPWSSN